MKIKLAKAVTVLTAIAIIMSQLPINMAVLADDLQNAPTEYPTDTVYIMETNLDYKSHQPEAEETKRKFSEHINFTDGDYDFFEFDLFLVSENIFEAVTLGIFDSKGNVAVFETGGFNSNWIHIKIATSDFVGESVDFTDICGYRLENALADVRYVLTNLCMTGIKQPEDMPKADIIRLKDRIDVVDTKTNSAMTEVFDFDGLEAVDLLSKDWLEFDVYVLGTKEESVDTTQTVSLVDENYGPDSKRGNNTAYHRFKIKTNCWNHIKVPTSGLTSVNCNTERIVGIMLSGMTDNYRYVVANVCLSTAFFDVPGVPENANVLQEGVLVKYFNTTVNGETPVAVFPSVIDITKGKHFIFDIFIDSAFADNQQLTFILKDANGKKATYTFVSALSEWINIKTPINAIVCEEGFDKTKCTEFSISGLSVTTRYLVANLGVLDVDMSIKDGYPENAVTKFEAFTLDYYVTTISDVKKETKILFDSTNASDCDFIEFDVFADTPVDSSALPEKISLAFFDGNGYEAVASSNYTYNQLVHIKISLSSLVNKDNGKPINITDICGVYLENAVTDYHYAIKNLCFTKIIPPEPPVNNVIKELLALKDITSTAHGYTCTPYVLFDGLDAEDETDVLDFTEAEYIEFDVYAVMDENREDFTEQIKPTLNVCDTQFKYITHVGKGEAGFTISVNEWNHIKIKISDIDISAGRNTDFTQMRGFFIGMSSPTNIRYVVANMCLGKRNVPEKDPVSMPIKPDKESKYISDCESPNSSEDGIWASTQTEFSTDYKTEGRASVMLAVRNQEIAALNSFKFLFNNTADFTASESLRFDLFVDDELLIDDCTTTVYFSNDRRYQKQNLCYILDSSKIKFGWNSFEIPLSSFKADSDVDLSQIICFAVEVVINEPFEVMGDFQEYFMIGMDNIRISKTYTFNNQNDNGNNNNGIEFGDNSGSSSENTSDADFNESDSVTEIIKYVEKEPEEQILRVKNHVVKKVGVPVDDFYGIHWIILIITASVAVVILTVNTVLLLKVNKKLRK